MSGRAGRLRKVLAYVSLDHIKYKFCLILSRPAEAYSMRQADAIFYSCERSISGENNPLLPLQNFPSLVLSRNALLSKFLSIICQAVAHGKLKTKVNFKLLALKMVAVA